MTLKTGLRSGCRVRGARRPRRTCRTCSSLVPVTIDSVSAGRATGSSILVIVEHPILGGPEVQGGECGDDHEQEPGHGGGVAHVETREAALIEVERVEERGVDWPAGA